MAATIRIVTDLEEFKSLEEVWNNVLHQCREHSSIYLTYEWSWIWWKHFGAGKKLNILIIESEGEVIGIIPLMKVDHGLGLFKIHVLETIGSTNYNNVGLIPIKNNKEAMIALIKYFQEELSGNKSILRLTFVPANSYFLNLLRGHDHIDMKSTVIREKFMTLAPYISLPTTWEEYFSSLGKRRRKVLHRALRSLEKEHTFEFKHFTLDTMEEELGRYFKLHQARWQSINIRSIFSNPRMREFYIEIANHFSKKDWLYFSYLTIDGEMVSAEFGSIYNQKLYAFNAARDIRYLKYSVGHLHKMYLLQDAIRKQLVEFDFLKGAEPYKFYWTKSFRKYVQVIMFKKCSYASLRFGLLYALLRLDEIIQNRHTLKEVFSLYRMKRMGEKEREKMRLFQDY